MIVESPADITRQAPRVVFWFKLYAGFPCFLYLGLAIFSYLLFYADLWDLGMSSREDRIVGTVLIAFGIVFFIACLVPFLFHPSAWLWVYDLVIICLGMGSALTLPASIPLLVYWIRPEAKSYFGKS